MNKSHLYWITRQIIIRIAISYLSLSACIVACGIDRSENRVGPSGQAVDASDKADIGVDVTTHSSPDASLSIDTDAFVGLDAAVDADAGKDAGAIEVDADRFADVQIPPEADLQISPDASVASEVDHVEMWASGYQVEGTSTSQEVSSGYFFHRVKGIWTATKTPEAPRPLGVVMLSFALSNRGLASDGFVLFEYDGIDWRTVQIPPTAGIFSVLALSDSYWMATVDGIVRRVSDQWTQTDRSLLNPSTNGAVLFEVGSVPWVCWHGLVTVDDSQITPDFVPPDFNQLARYDDVTQKWQLDHEINSQTVDADSYGSEWTAILAQRSLTIMGRVPLLYLYDGHQWDEIELNQETTRLGDAFTGTLNFTRVATPEQGTVLLAGNAVSGVKFPQSTSRGIVLRYQNGEFELLDDPLINQLSLVEIEAVNASTFWVAGLKYINGPPFDEMEHHRIIRYEKGAWYEETLPDSDIDNGFWRISRMTTVTSP